MLRIVFLQKFIELSVHKKIYFASDFHLGFPNAEYSKERELRIIAWLSSIKDTCEELFLVGDVFDFWYEYRWVVPKGFVRFLAKLAEFTDEGIPVHMFWGNHDTWLFNYLPNEIGVQIHKGKVIREFGGKRFFIHHGHALGNFDKGMNFLNAIFTNNFLRWWFNFVHPNVALSFGHRWSRFNRRKKVYESENYLGDDKEWLMKYSQNVLDKEFYDYFIFGHRHIAVDKSIQNNSRYINLGNWITNTTYAVFDGNTLELKAFKPDVFPEAIIIRD